MNIVSRTASALALSAAALGGFAATASPASAADGYVYVWDGAFAGGTECAWTGSDADWSTCRDRSGTAHNMLNRAGHLYNSGYAVRLDKVNFYWGKGYAGSWACLGQGDQWPNLAAEGHTFTWGPGLSGYRQRIVNNIASHKWVDTCGN